jgi:hypothetical protein
MFWPCLAIEFISNKFEKLFTREFSPGIQMFPDTKFPQTFPYSKIPDTARKGAVTLKNLSRNLSRNVKKNISALHYKGCYTKRYVACNLQWSLLKIV